MRTLVTGGAGYIGSHLVDALLGLGHDVTVLDDLSTGSLSNIASHIHAGEIDFVEGSILDLDTVDKYVSASELVFHLAAAVGVKFIVEEPLVSLLTNTRGTDIVLGSCHRHDVRVLLASTSEVYGKTLKVPFEEDDDRVLGPTTIHRWGYSTSKAFDEHLALAYADAGLEISIVRYFNSYGPRLDPRGYGSVVANFIRQSIAGEPITVHGDGRQTRCFTYVDDTVTGTVAAGIADAAIGRVINLGTTEETAIGDLATTIRDMIGSTSEIRYVPYEDYYGGGFEDTRRRVPNIDRASSLLRWKPEVHLRDGLERTIAWWRETHG